MDALIRHAAKEDAVSLARLMYMAGQGHVEPSVYDLMIPGPPGASQQRLSQLESLLVVRAVSMFHHSHYMVAEVDGEVAASLAAMDKDSGRKCKTTAALVEIGWNEREFELMTKAMQPVFRVSPPVQKGAWIIENVATLPRYRRQGLANTLLEEALAEGRRRGLSSAQISCFIGNKLAQRAYEKVGFDVTDQYRDDAFQKIFYCPGMSRLELEL